MKDSSTKTNLYFGPRYKKSPFFEATRRAGCKAYGIYNHMSIPDYYDDPVDEYYSLTNDVTLWDVSVERIVEITGPDASEFTNRLTPRDLTKCAVGQGKYVLITAGRFDVLAEVLCEDNDALLTLVNDRILQIDGVASTEVSPVLKMEKLTFSWGTG